MIIDFNQSDAPSSFNTRICIVGSGVIGLTLLSEFLKLSGIDILIVETGAVDVKDQMSIADDVINSGDVSSGVEGSTARVFGGASTLWGGQALPFSSYDFETKDWLEHSGWPIEYETLKPYYKRAADVLALDDANFSENIWESGSSSQEKINPDLLNLTYSKWSPFPNLSKVFKHTIEKSNHINVLVNACVSDITLDNDISNVNHLKVKNAGGKQGQLFADIFILCGGGIDNARLLLASNGLQKQGVGNQSGHVGKFYQDHIGFYGAQLIPKDFSAFKHLFSNVLRGKQKYLPKLELSTKLQQSKQLLNINGNLSIQTKDDAPINQLKQAYTNLTQHGLSTKMARPMLNAVKSPGEFFKIIDSYFIKHRKYIPEQADFFLIANCESMPCEHSAIRLSDQLDIFGLPKAQIEWMITEQSRQTLIVYYETVKAELDRLGIAQTVIKPVLYQANDEWKNHCYSLYHHMGATRMSESENDGVVNPNCKVHGVKNLYLAGSSVFPTSSASNPTLTAMALAIRLADYLKQH